MKRIVEICFCLVVVIMLLAPLLLTNTEEGAFSSTDGHMLVAPPSFGDKDLPAKTEDWLRDRLGMKDSLADAFFAINDNLFDELINSTYQYGKDKYVFFNIHSNVKYSDYHKQFAEMVSDIQEYCEARGTKFYYVFNPEKESVYRRYLPDGVNYNDEWVDLMLAEMDSLGVNYIDLRGVLTDKSYDEFVFNRIYDAGHWNHNGAYYGMKTLSERIHKDIPEVDILDKDEYDVDVTIAEKIYGSNQIFNEKVPRYTLKAGYMDNTDDLGSELEANKWHPYYQLVYNDSSKAAGINTLLFFEDEVYEPFAFARAKETLAISCLQNVANFDYYYNIFKPDVVVFENIEYVVSDAYFNLNDMSLNPPIIENYPEEDFAERRDAVLKTTAAWDTDCLAVLLPGKAIDKVFIDQRIEDARYAYILTDHRAIDLNKDDNGALTASIRHDDLPADNDVVLYYLDDKGVGHYTEVQVTTQRSSILMQEKSTKGITYDNKSKSFTLTTDIDDNYFSSVVIQLMDSEGKKYLSNVNEAGSLTGKTEGAYCHTLESGDYSIVLKGNTNLGDEFIEYKVYLEKGQTYWYSYIIDEFSEKQIVVRDFGFSKSK